MANPLPPVPLQTPAFEIPKEPAAGPNFARWTPPWEAWLRQLQRLLSELLNQETQDEAAIQQLQALLNQPSQGTGTTPSPTPAPPTAQPYHVVCYLPGAPAASQIVLEWTCPADLPNGVSFAKNFGGNARGTLQADPAATAAYTLYKNGVSIGSMSISTGGAFTFTLTAATLFAAQDVLTAQFQGSTDATLSGVGFTLPGTR